MAAPPSILFIFNSLAKFSQLAFFFFKMAKKTFGFLEAKCQEFLFLLISRFICLVLAWVAK
jgi:hypothetical protein